MKRIDEIAAWWEAIRSEYEPQPHSPADHIAYLLGELERAHAALRDIAMWCEEGREVVTAWPAQRARLVLEGDTQ